MRNEEFSVAPQFFVALPVRMPGTPIRPSETNWPAGFCKSGCQAPPRDAPSGSALGRWAHRNQQIEANAMARILVTEAAASIMDSGRDRRPSQRSGAGAVPRVRGGRQGKRGMKMKLEMKRTVTRASRSVCVGSSFLILCSLISNDNGLGRESPPNPLHRSGRPEILTRPRQLGSPNWAIQS